MSYAMRHALSVLFFVCSFLMIMGPAFSQDDNDATEPSVRGPGVIDLLEGGTLDAWQVPSDHWSMDQGRIVGHTGPEKLKLPEWLYTEQRFGDFQFTCELRLTGDNRRNTGIYYRVNVIPFKGHGKKKGDSTLYEAASGYEFDAAFANPNRKNFWGSLGDWYARPSLRIYPDPTILNQAYSPEKWNRMTIRARGNRLEYWINGIKVMDYVDKDPKASREGIIGLQIHDGSVMKIEYRNIRVLPLEPSQTRVFSDDFSEPELMSTWRFFDYTEAGNASVSVIEGELAITAAGSDVYKQRNAFAGIARNDIQGDFDVSVNVISQDAIHPWSQAGLFIMNDLSDRTQGGYAFLTVTPTRVAYFWDEQEPIGELEHNTQIMTTKKPVWLRLVKKGKLLSSYFRVNEDDEWTPVVIDNATLNLADNVYVGLYSFSHSSAQTGTVHMDDFLCTQ